MSGSQTTPRFRVMTIPGYWMNETSGVFRPAVERYLLRKTLSAEDVAALRSYLRQWIAGDFRGPDIEGLRDGINSLTNRAQIDGWLERALDAGIDPF